MVKAEIHKSSQTLISFNTNELHGHYSDIYTTIIIHITLLRFLFGVGLLPNVYYAGPANPARSSPWTYPVVYVCFEPDATHTLFHRMFF